MATKLTEAQITKTLQTADKTARKLIKSLPASSDAMAIALYDKGVRGARCRNARSCALAQYLANGINIKGLAVSVNGFDVDLIYHGRSIERGLPVKAINFIERFDEGNYKFLNRK